MDAKRILGGLFVFGIGALIVFGRMSDRDEMSDVSKTQAMTLLATVENYDRHRGFYDAWGKLAHERAFSDAFEMGGRRRASKFDPNRYMSLFFEELIDLAQGQGKQDIVKDLIALRDKQGIPQPQ